MAPPDTTPGWLLGDGALGGNLQTIWPAVVCKRVDGFRPTFVRERWTTPDADFIDVDWLEPACPVTATTPVGISLGGNALLRWAEEAGESASASVAAVAAVSSPVDLTACGHAIRRGFNQLVYTRMFMNLLRPKALHKLRRFPGLFSRDKMLAARDLYEFDNLYTAPVHGFRHADDYWSNASAKPHLHRIRIPALVLNARNDPFVPAASLPRAPEVGRHVTLWQPARGGHTGFASGPFPGRLLDTPSRVLHWLRPHA